MFDSTYTPAFFKMLSLIKVDNCILCSLYYPINKALTVKPVYQVGCSKMNAFRCLSVCPHSLPRVGPLHFLFVDSVAKGCKANDIRMS